MPTWSSFFARFEGSGRKVQGAAGRLVGRHPVVSPAPSALELGYVTNAAETSSKSGTLAGGLPRRRPVTGSQYGCGTRGGFDGWHGVGVVADVVTDDAVGPVVMSSATSSPNSNNCSSTPRRPTTCSASASTTCRRGSSPSSAALPQNSPTTTEQPNLTKDSTPCSPASNTAVITIHVVDRVPLSPLLPATLHQTRLSARPMTARTSQGAQQVHLRPLKVPSGIPRSPTRGSVTGFPQSVPLRRCPDRHHCCAAARSSEGAICRGALMPSRRVVN